MELKESVAAIKEKKMVLETSILNSIKDFEAATGIAVETIYLLHSTALGKSPMQQVVNVEVAIKI